MSSLDNFDADINTKLITVVDSKQVIITNDLILIMKNREANWKVHTSTIDQMHDTIKQAIETEPGSTDG